MFNWLANEKLNKAIDTISKLAQIAALAVAGWWAYDQFHRTVQPGLEFRGTVETNLDWTKSSDPKDCLANLDISIKNDGVSSFNVSKMLVRGWLFTSDKKLQSANDRSIPKPTIDRPVPVELDEIEQGEPFYVREYTQEGDSLNGHYPPGVSFHESYNFVFHKARGQGVVFKVDVKTAENVTQFVPSAWVSDETCTIETPSSEKKNH